jgi:hypothetical protein
VNVKDRTGETNIATNGQVMTIVRYNSATDLDIQFEDGTIVYNKEYAQFKRGYIKNPNHMHNSIGEVVLATNGQKMQLIKYRDTSDVDVQFEDGTVVYHKHYNAFKKGTVQNPNKPIVKTINRVGETRIAHNGMRMRVMVYRWNKDIDVQFEDGTVVEHKQYNDFKNGTIKHP